MNIKKIIFLMVLFVFYVSCYKNTVKKGIYKCNDMPDVGTQIYEVEFYPYNRFSYFNPLIGDLEGSYTIKGRKVFLTIEPYKVNYRYYGKSDSVFKIYYYLADDQDAFMSTVLLIYGQTKQIDTINCFFGKTHSTIKIYNENDIYVVPYYNSESSIKNDTIKIRPFPGGECDINLKLICLRQNYFFYDSLLIMKKKGNILISKATKSVFRFTTKQGP